MNDTAQSSIFTALDHPEIVAAWAEYEAANERASADYWYRVQFREVRPAQERHLYPVPVTS